MSQSRRDTVVEVLTGTFAGTLGSWLIVWGVLAWSPWGAAVNATVTTALCTVWSLVRGYAVRRAFNRAAKPLAGGWGPDRQCAAATLAARAAIARSNARRATEKARKAAR